MIKTSMVAIWESDHKFASLLGDLQGRKHIIFPNYKTSQIANTVKMYFLLKKKKKYDVRAIKEVPPDPLLNPLIVFQETFKRIF